MNAPQADDGAPAKRWQRNSVGLYDCPVPTCNRRGRNGFARASQAGTHAWAIHRVGGAWRTQAPPVKYVRNEHGLFDCPHPACDRKGIRGLSTAQAAGRHATIHGIRGSSSEALRRRRKIADPDPPQELSCPECGRGDFATARSLARHRSIDHGIPGKSRASQHRHMQLAQTVQFPLATRTQRPLQSQRTGPALQAHIESPPAQDDLNHCPRCGMDLHELRANLDGPVAFRRCPRCKCNLSMVAAALSPAVQQLDPAHAASVVSVVQRVLGNLV